jgi:hypothetical protein
MRRRERHLAIALLISFVAHGSGLPLVWHLVHVHQQAPLQNTCLTACRLIANDLHTEQIITADPSDHSQPTTPPRHDHRRCGFCLTLAMAKYQLSEVPPATLAAFDHRCLKICAPVTLTEARGADVSSCRVRAPPFNA